MKKLLTVTQIAGLFLLPSYQAQAHLHFMDFGTLTNAGDSGSYTFAYTAPHSWKDGTDNDLGDSHAFNSGATIFSLSQASTVRITASTNNGLVNPAFSIYSGALPPGAHDYTNLDNSTYGGMFNAVGFNGVSSASLTDKHPDDPLISRYVPAGYDANGKPLTYDGSNPILTENPVWNTPDPSLGGITPAQWYETNYQPHNGYRDLLNYTNLGGMKYVDMFNSWMPGNTFYDDVTGDFASGYTGQFDAFGDWSMANDLGEWAKIQYISSVSSTDCNGPNCVSTDTGGFSNPGHFAGNDGLTESLILNLGPGVYSIFAGGEACLTYYAADCTPANSPLTVTASLLAPVTVPVPGAFWLMVSGLLGFCKVQAGRRKS